MSESVEYTVRINSKNYGTFDFPFTVVGETADLEDWYREILAQSRKPVEDRLNTLGYSSLGEDKSAQVSIINAEDVAIWEYQLDKTDLYESVTFITVPSLVVNNPATPPRRLL